MLRLIVVGLNHMLFWLFIHIRLILLFSLTIYIDYLVWHERDASASSVQLLALAGVWYLHAGGINYIDSGLNCIAHSHISAQLDLFDLY